MRFWRLLIVGFAVVALWSYVDGVFAKRAREKREVAYQETLRSYSAALKPGMRRQDVECYLTTRNISFSRGGLSVPEDLIKIGNEEVPWWCTGGSIYVRFQFIPHDQRANPVEITLSELDILARVDIYRSVACLN